MKNNEKCPECEGTNIKKGIQTSYARIYPIDSKMKKGSEVIVHICGDCGYILSMRVKDLDIFR